MGEHGHRHVLLGQRLVEFQDFTSESRTGSGGRLARQTSHAPAHVGLVAPQMPDFRRSKSELVPVRPIRTSRTWHVSGWRRHVGALDCHRRLTRRLRTCRLQHNAGRGRCEPARAELSLGRNAFVFGRPVRNPAIAFVAPAALQVVRASAFSALPNLGRPYPCFPCMAASTTRRYATCAVSSTISARYWALMSDDPTPIVP